MKNEDKSKILLVLIIFLFTFSSQVFAQSADGSVPPADPAAGTTPAPDPVPIPAPTSTTPVATPTPKLTPKITPKPVAPAPLPIVAPVITLDPVPIPAPQNNYTGIIVGILAVGLGTALFFGLKAKPQKTNDKQNKKCLNFKKLMEDKLNELTDLRGHIEDLAKDEVLKQLPYIEKVEKEYARLRELYEQCITSLKWNKKEVLIFHGTEGYPEENWFPWLKGVLEGKSVKTSVPQFPSPKDLPAKVDEWFQVLKDYQKSFNEDTIIVGHSLGGVFLLKILEKLDKPIGTAVFVGTPIGVKPILNYDRDKSFAGFDFDWEKIKKNARNFIVYQSDDDPYVGLANGEELARNLGVKLSFIPGAGHFNTKAGYTKFEDLQKKLESLL